MKTSSPKHSRTIDDPRAMGVSPKLTVVEPLGPVGTMNVKTRSCRVPAISVVGVGYRQSDDCSETT